MNQAEKNKILDIKNYVLDRYNTLTQRFTRAHDEKLKAVCDCTREYYSEEMLKLKYMIVELEKVIDYINIVERMQ